jgi:hypothetical protein
VGYEKGPALAPGLSICIIHQRTSVFVLKGLLTFFNIQSTISCSIIKLKGILMPFASQYVAPILKKDIGVGTLVWYKGLTSRGSWDCPAVVYRVSPKRRNFRVMSLDDMVKQNQDYRLDPHGGEYSSSSRHNMRLASVAEVDTYLLEHLSGATAAQIITEVQMHAAAGEVRLGPLDKVI